MSRDHTLHIKGVCCNKPLNKVQLDHNEREYYLLTYMYVIMLLINAILFQPSYCNICTIMVAKRIRTSILNPL